MFMSALEYRDSLRRYQPREFVNGERVASVADEPRLLPGINALGITYEYALDPQHQRIARAVDHRNGREINRFLHITQSREDLLTKLEYVRLVCQETGCAMRVAVTVISSRAMAGSGANWAVATVGASAAVKRSARERGRVLETSMVSGQKMSASTMRAGGKVQLWIEFFRQVSRGRAGGVAAIYRSTRSRGMDFFRCRWEFLLRGGQKI
jgi:hypothetical protein